MATPIALSLLIHIIVSGQLVMSSPPVDFFYYTSQNSRQNAASEAHHGDTRLQSLESIYSLSQDAAHTGHDAHLQEVANKVLAIIRNATHTHDNDQVDVETARVAWRLMENQATLYMKNQVNSLKPFAEELIREAKVSESCRESIAAWLESLGRLELWSTKMWNAWGNLPSAGVLEGSFTDLGSYAGCLNVKDNDIIGQSQYCMLDFQPVVPTRPRYHSIYKRVLLVDPKSGMLTGGDYHTDQLNSKIVSHVYSSGRFRNEGHQEVDESTDTSPGSKYSKRTIAHNGTLEVVPPSSADLHSNLTLKLSSKALMEFARKAQYFYYVKFRLGACLPSKCSPADVQKLASAGGQRAILQANPVNCMKREPGTWNSYQWVAIAVLGSLALVAIAGTVVDLLGFKDAYSQNGSVSYSLVTWLLPFSMWTNARRLFDAGTVGTHGDLECIHGLRFFSMVWVIYGHTILYSEYQSFTHFYDVVEQRLSSFILLPTLNANFSVDTFFVISGILTTYVTWEYTKGDARKFNKFAFLISRYVRLTPQLAIVILCFFLLPLFGDGPMFRQVTEDKAEVCYRNWGLNLLYMQSYIRSEKLCIDPSWWLSIEMTFHVVSMIVIVAMIHSPQRGMIVNFIVAAVLTLWGVVIHYSNGLAIQYLPSIPQRYEVSLEQTKLFFHRPYPHAPSYFIGTALGYVLANHSVKKFTKAQLYQGWTVCAIGLIASLWGSYFWNLGAPYTQLQATVFYNLCQIIWPLSIAWIILACSIGQGGIVDSILSARCFVPLGRVTYMTYLSHALIIYYHSAMTSMPVEPSMLLFTYMFIANTVLALILGVVLTVVYESPILNLQKVLFEYLTKKFDPTIKNQRRNIPSSVVCDKSVSSPASDALLLPNNAVPRNGLSNNKKLSEPIIGITEMNGAANQSEFQKNALISYCMTLTKEDP